jgi:hypothetical protein
MAKRSSPLRWVLVGAVRTDPTKPRTTDPAIPPGQSYVSPAQLDDRFGVAVKWVHARKLQLGATLISNSAKSKLRYYLPTADTYVHGWVCPRCGRGRRRRVISAGRPFRCAASCICPG